MWKTKKRRAGQVREDITLTMEIVIPSRPSSSSSPNRFEHYYYNSAPSSPSFISAFYQKLDNPYAMNDGDDDDANSSSSAIPFSWEVTPGTPKEDDEFAFDFSAELEQASLTAEELFDGGKIRPLKPPPRLQVPADDEYAAGETCPLLSSPRSPKSPNPFTQGKRIIREALSPRNNKQKADLFAVGAVGNTQKQTSGHERGRQRRDDLSSGSRRATRSLSPYRVSQYPWEEEEEEEEKQQHQKQPPPPPQQPIKQSSFNSKPPPPPPHPPSAAAKSSSRKWRFTDFLLFRSASEGRAADKDPLRKYSGFKRNEEKRNPSSRSTEGSGSGRRKGPVSAHELHYTKNKAAAQGLKKKTFLPYKSGIFGFHGLGAFSRS